MLNKTNVRLTQADVALLNAYDWPGNIRELENVIERAVILSRNGRLVFELPGSLQVKPVENPNPGITGIESQVKTREELNREERNNIITALQQTAGKVFGKDGAAQLLQMQPTTLASKIKRLGIDRTRYKTSA